MKTLLILLVVFATQFCHEPEFTCLECSCATWLDEFGVCMTGPVDSHCGDYCQRYGMTHGDTHLDLRDYALVQRNWPCCYVDACDGDCAANCCSSTECLPGWVWTFEDGWRRVGDE